MIVYIATNISIGLKYLLEVLNQLDNFSKMTLKINKFENHVITHISKALNVTTIVTSVNNHILLTLLFSKLSFTSLFLLSFITHAVFSKS